MSNQQPGNELAELVWDDGTALRRPPAAHIPAAPFPPFACSAAGTSSSSIRAQEFARHPASATAMRDLFAAQDDDAVPWRHYPAMGVDDDDSDTAPLPPEYCSTLLSGLPAEVASRDARGEPSTSHCAVVVPPPLPEPAAPKQQQQPRASGEGIMNFTFFSKPLQRPPPHAGERASAAPSNPVESTVLQASTNRLRSTALFSEQRMAWLQPPKESRATTSAAPPPPPPAPPVFVRQVEAAAALPQRLQPEARAPERPPPPPTTATSSSVCSDNGERRQLKRSSGHQAPEWSLSQEDEDLDDESGGQRRSASRSTKRGRTAEVHNMSERRRRDRINEKMRALQELIPNCNKFDKASMLEEAIEYLKTLQLQVQMMSTMGTAGLCMPPMLAMQHMQMPTMAHFHHHHLGAMGFGMGAFDPRLVAAAGAAQYPYPMIPGMPMFGHGHTMPSQPPFPQQAAAASAQMAVGTVVNNDAASQAEQQTSSDHPQVPRAM